MSRLMVHVQQFEEEKIKEKEWESKRSEQAVLIYLNKGQMVELILSSTRNIHH